MGNKVLQLNVTVFTERYRLNYPQLVQMDERYLCLIGGTQQQSMNHFNTPRLPDLKEDDSDDP